MNQNRLSPLSLGLSLGILWGLSLVLMGLLAHYVAYGQTFVTAIGTVYFGYAPSITGSLLGGGIGFIDAFITGFLIAWLYNKFAGCHCISKDKTEEK